ncbi:MAG: hypothetical protein LBV22_02030 [Mycoplasmataceae bacterium]|jgi:hypothetical protein|nr:hypothetical protein [Mycoplasmataceae bacterium]
MLGLIFGSVINGLNIFVIIYLFLIIRNAKYYLFKSYKHTTKWLTILSSAVIVSIISILIDKETTVITLIITSVAIGFSAINFLVYFFLPIKLNSLTYSVKAFDKIDFAKIITKYNISTSKEELAKLIQQQKNKKNNIMDDYVIACNQLQSFNNKNFIIILQQIIKFNNKVKIFNRKQNEVIQKLTLYLCMDLQTALKQKLN